jgi:hypothetical protein
MTWPSASGVALVTPGNRRRGGVEVLQLRPLAIDRQMPVEAEDAAD